jgi:hypothetical protein
MDGITTAAQPDGDKSPRHRVRPIDRMVIFTVVGCNPFEPTIAEKSRDRGKPIYGLIEEALMQKWKVTFVDDHGEIVDEVFEREECPSDDEAARLVKERLLPVAAKLDLNDLEGRTADAGVKNLKTQNGIEIRSITPV